MINLLFHNIPDDTRYAFAVAKIRALESKMLDQSLITRLLKSNGTNEMFKILMDTDYGTCLNEAGDASFETVLDNKLLRAYMLIHSIDPDPKWTDIWRLRYDAHNIKVILKSASSNKEMPNFFIPYSLVDPQIIFNAFQQGEYEFFPPPIKNGVEMILHSKEEKEKVEGEIDFIIDRALYHYLSQEAKGCKNIFIMHLVDMLIDFINLSAFLRIRTVKGSKDLFHYSFLPGGKISEENFSFQEDKEAGELVRGILEKTPYKGLRRFVDSKNLVYLETAMENFLILYLRQTRQRVFGVEPLVGYIFAKESEIKNLRLLYIGKINGLEEVRIKERLRDTYV